MATAGISLVRDNTERQRPPRFLWVPFELGRPLGRPNDPELQFRVLRQLLSLLGRDGPPPILENFPENSFNEYSENIGWSCPVPFSSSLNSKGSNLLSSLLKEISDLAPWHQYACDRRGRTTTGVLEVPIGEIAVFLHSVLVGNLISPNSEVSVGQAFRLGCEELKTYYLESAMAKPAPVLSHVLSDWFWGDTVAGRLLLKLYPVALNSKNEDIRQVGISQLVPRRQYHRLG